MDDSSVTILLHHIYDTMLLFNHLLRWTAKPALQVQYENDDHNFKVKNTFRFHSCTKQADMQYVRSIKFLLKLIYN